MNPNNLNTQSSNSFLELRSYFEILKNKNKLKKDILKTIRIAFLADCSLQHLSTILGILGNERGLNLEIYQGDFDSIEMEVIDPKSKFYAFDPQFVIIIQQVQNLKSRFYGAISPDIVDEKILNITTIWDSIRKNLNIPIIQSTFVIPAERTFGNYELMVPNSLGSRTVEINSRIIVEAQKRKDILINDINYLASEFGRKNWRDEKLWLMAKAPCALEGLPILAKNILDIIFAATGRITKCVILDLDNTLWGGIIGDDGLEGIRLGDFEDGYAFSQLQQFVLALKNRGIILAVCSKNEISNALLPFQHHPEMILKEADIAAFIANWNDKASNISEIQKILNIGFDSMVFLDDNPFERNLVKGILPDVLVPELPEDPTNYLSYLATLNLFEATTFSSADLERSELYRVEAQRVQLKSNFDSVDDYLNSLDMQINLERFNRFNLPRIAQLIQRSNQYNLTTKRYSEAECESLSLDFEHAFPFTLTLADKFGSYGLICVCILKFSGGDAYIDEFLMSCRVLQRGVEDYAMNRIFAEAKSKGVKKVIGSYIPSPKNSMVKDFYDKFKFKLIETSDLGVTTWTKDVDSYENIDTIMQSVGS